MKFVYSRSFKMPNAGRKRQPMIDMAFRHHLSFESLR